jgi:hypothetical protein
MTAITLELQETKTDETGNEFDQWVSTTAKLGGTRLRFVTLSQFDLSVARKLDRLAALKAGWDAEAALPICRRILLAAREFVLRLPGSIKGSVPAPAVVPMARGADRPSNLQFEWDDGTRSLELEIETPTTIHYLKWDPDEGCEEEGFFGIRDRDRTSSLIRWFAGS